MSACGTANLKATCGGANLEEEIEESYTDNDTCGTANLEEQRRELASQTPLASPQCTYNEDCGRPATRSACHFGTVGPPRCEEHSCAACPKITALQAPLAPPQVVVSKYGYRYCYYLDDVCKNCGEEFGSHSAKFPHPFRGKVGRRKLNQMKNMSGEFLQCDAFVFGHMRDSGEKTLNWRITMERMKKSKGVK